MALEQADIADLRGMLARSSDAEVHRVFTHLLAASQHHLAVFTNTVNGGSDAAFCAGTGNQMRAQMGDRGNVQGMRMGLAGGTVYRLCLTDS